MCDDSNDRLWDDDAGTLPLEARDVLVRLVKEPCLFEEAGHARWQTLKRWQADIASRLADLGQELVVNDEFGVAFARQMRVDGLYQLLNVQPLKAPATWLLCDCVRGMGVWEAQGGKPEAFRVLFEDELERARQPKAILADASTDEQARKTLLGAFDTLKGQGWLYEKDKQREWSMTSLWRAAITPEVAEGWLTELASAVGTDDRGGIEHD